MTAQFRDGSGSMEGEPLRLGELGQPGLLPSTFAAKRRPSQVLQKRPGTAGDDESFTKFRLPEDSDEQQEIQFALSDSPSAKNHRTTLRDHPTKMSTERLAVQTGLLSGCLVGAGSEKISTAQEPQSQRSHGLASGSTCRSP